MTSGDGGGSSDGDGDGDMSDGGFIMMCATSV